MSAMGLVPSGKVNRIICLHIELLVLTFDVCAISVKKMTQCYAGYGLHRST